MMISKRAPEPGGDVTFAVPPCAFGDRFDDGQAKAGTTRRVVVRAFPGEAPENALGVTGRHARTAVLHPDRRGAAAVGCADADGVVVSGELHRVRGELHDRLGDPLAIGDDDHRVRRITAPVPYAERSDLLVGLEHHLTKIYRVGVKEVGTLGHGQQEEVVDDTAHPVDLVDDQTDGVPTLRGCRICVDRLSMTADHRQRCSQLVTGVVEELPLRLERPFETGKHLVEGRGDLGGLVTAGQRDALVQLGIGDPCRRPSQRDERPQDAPGQQQTE